MVGVIEEMGPKLTPESRNLQKTSFVNFRKYVVEIRRKYHIEFPKIMRRRFRHGDSKNI